MKIDARLDLYNMQGPDSLEESWGTRLPLDHIICRDVDGTPHSVGEFIWPWSAYTKDQRKFVLHFYYWIQKTGPAHLIKLHVSVEREARIRELQFLMTRQLFYGHENGPKTLQEKLYTLKYLARFAEARSCTIRDVLTETSLLDACSESIPNSRVFTWMGWLNLLRQLDPETQLGFTLATPKHWNDLERRAIDLRNNSLQHAPLPTRIYGELINNLSAEIDDIEAHAPRLLAALRDALLKHAQSKKTQNGHKVSVGPTLIEKYGLRDYLVRRGFSLRSRALAALSGAVTEVFLVCKLQIHVFSGMRHDEARTLPYHCMVTQKSRHGRTHSLIAGVTTKFSKGRRLRTHWVTTDHEGFRAVRLAQRFAAVIYESLNITPSKADAYKDEFSLFPATYYLPWCSRRTASEARIQSGIVRLVTAKESLHARLFPLIQEEDIMELEEIDPFRAWCDESKFSIGQRWPLSTHQLRRSLAVYANASGLVSLSSLRRQLQHITREMSLYYGRGSTFCKNFIANDPDGYKAHVALEWQDGEDEAMMLAFTRDVLNSKEPMFGGAGNFYQRQKERGEVMTREDVETRMKAGLLSYTPGPLGGCTKTRKCDKRKGLALIDISCATDGCKNLVGKHSKIIRVIQLKRAAMAHVTQGSIEASIEKEELEALERVEREWRPHTTLSEPPTGVTHA
jgi:hypothetical protein